MTPSKNAMTKSRFPLAFLNSEKGYSVVLNLLGINRKDIVIDVDTKKREFVIYAAKHSRSRDDGYFWIFSVPTDALLKKISVLYKTGGLQITVPRVAHLG